VSLWYLVNVLVKKRRLASKYYLQYDRMILFVSVYKMPLGK